MEDKDTSAFLYEKAQKGLALIARELGAGKITQEEFEDLSLYFKQVLGTAEILRVDNGSLKNLN